MSGVNKVILLGRFGKDPEISYTSSGMAVCKFSIATSKKTNDGTETTSWHRCIAFDKAGEIISQYMKKGNEIYVEGELRYSQHKKDGVTQYYTSIVVSQFNFVGGQSVVDRSSNMPNPGAPSMPPDDDIPF